MAKRIAGRQVKVQPKLRMLANGSTEVNTLRAEHAAAVRVPEREAKSSAPRRTQRSVPVAPNALPKAERKTHKLTEPPRTSVSAFLRLREDSTHLSQSAEQRAGITARKANLATAELPAADAVALREEPWVAQIELGQPLAVPTPLVSSERARAPALSARKFGDGRRHRFGEGGLVGLIDVAGFDFAHPDFLDERGGTRFVRIWDQGGDARRPPAERETREPKRMSAFAYGAELRKDELDRAIARSGGEAAPRAPVSDGRGLTWHTRRQHRRRQPRHLPRGVHRWRADLNSARRRGSPQLLL